MNIYYPREPLYHPKFSCTRGKGNDLKYAMHIAVMMKEMKMCSSIHTHRRFRHPTHTNKRRHTLQCPHAH